MSSNGKDVQRTAVDLQRGRSPSLKKDFRRIVLNECFLSSAVSQGNACNSMRAWFMGQLQWASHSVIAGTNPQ